jgi:4-amino-4-deoxy-L-arabinose transferase-like glycosyltransferase
MKSIQHLSIKHIAWSFTLAVFIILICPGLIQDGMFMDGQQYAIVAKNLANGSGSFWFPHLSDTWMKAGSSSFMEHPPLVYGIESLFFRLFGYSMYTERLYSLSTAILSAYLIVLCWRLISTDEEMKKLAWFPVLLWILIPVNYWSYQNNMQENTMGLFTLLAVYFLIRALIQKSQVFIFLTLGGAAIFLASFSKGPPGLFPLATIGIYWISIQKISFIKVLSYTFYILFIPSLIYALLLLNVEAKESLSFYFFDRLLYRINNEGVVENRFYSISKTLLELAPGIILSLVIMLVAKRKYKEFKPSKTQKNWALFFLLLGISGSFPLILTAVQRGFYLVPAMPFFAIAITLYTAPFLSKLLKKIKPKTTKWLTVVSAILLLISLSFSMYQVGKTGRDKEMLHDVYIIGEQIPEGTSVKIEAYLYDNWSLQFYLLRYFDISLGPSVDNSDYFLVEKGHAPSLDFEKVSLDTKLFDLYKRMN